MEGLRAYAARELVELLENPRPIPLIDDRVRIDRYGATGLIETILEVRLGDVHGTVEGLPGPLAAAVEQVRLALEDAYPVPFTSQVRLPTATTRALARRLRAAGSLDL